MRNFFELDSNQNVVVNPDLYTISIFKKILDRDKSKDKSKAIMDLSFIFWMCDFRSYIADITDLIQREKEVITLVDQSGKYKPDKLVEEAMIQYRKDLPISLLFLEDVKVAVNELRKYFREVNLQEEDDKGKLKHDANKVMANITKTGELLSTLEKHEEKVKKDLDSNNTVQGGKNKGMYED